MLGVEWVGIGCCAAGTTTWCPDDSSPSSPTDSPTSPGEKDFCRPTWEWADPVTVYAGVECTTVGFTAAEAREQARQTLVLGRSAAVEQWWTENYLATNALDITPDSGPLPVERGIAALEGFLAIEYGGSGVIHAPAGVGALLGCCNVVRLDGGRLRTITGNCVVIGAGYDLATTGPDGPAPDGEAWVYITGPVVVRREESFDVPNTDAEQVRITTNDRQALAEQAFVVASTCVVGAIRVSEVCPTP